MNRAIKVLTAILAIAAPMLAVASPASASHDNGDGGSDYPPNTAMLTTPTHTTTRGAHLTLIASGFVPGATITFTISQGDRGHDGEDRRGHGRDHPTTLGTKVADANGGATLNTLAPRDAGKYRVTASSPDGLRASLTLTVTAKPKHDHCPDDRSPRPSHDHSSGHEQCGTSSGHGSDD